MEGNYNRMAAKCKEKGFIAGRCFRQAQSDPLLTDPIGLILKPEEIICNHLPSN
jgi:hypothetical protein